jgi:hypothetical protein
VNDAPTERDGPSTDRDIVWFSRACPLAPDVDALTLSQGEVAERY